VLAWAVGTCLAINSAFLDVLAIVAQFSAPRVTTVVALTVTTETRPMAAMYRLELTHLTTRTTPVGHAAFAGAPGAVEYVH
jgi:hypothetical protein